MTMTPQTPPDEILSRLCLNTQSVPPEEENWVREKGIDSVDGRWFLPDRSLFVPDHLAHPLLHQLHENTHMGKTALEALVNCSYYVAKLPTLCKNITQRCYTCARNHAKQRPSQPPGIQENRTKPV